MEHIEYQLEELMGDGKTWQRVYWDHGAGGETPRYVCFSTIQAARAYANSNSGHGWRPNPIERGVVRVIKLHTTITPV